ncbi:methyltransferase domain-containing protein [Acinetobacter baumannii]|uniref:methyltransferase domain-containing protein n=1 Tax=Acinetobacter baumannii TaxID=470 RepID=UPI00057D90C6|nr:methyltransferase domain-containing protein [Acinetobacter baumannii]EHU2110181.1 methyltransferase domain-containing protein [Acinetobacter baumannii]EHZ6774841.1 methyltransferase domain-containing protein [Acinetobacter baumannii]EKU3485987.1 methyltransferase domain-containing protein [Acinetobacter baumannii]EKU6395425.1 methyltransferase domain-containing protein [Acinetobacter baumannii]EKU8080638.1 methyltransferase domain-containing protein [Acinetobacter baumannii]
MDGLSKICEGVFQCNENNGPSEIVVQERTLNRIMDFFYIDGPADQLNRNQVSALCHARAKEPRCLTGANKIIKDLFKTFLINNQAKSILEVGAGKNPILTAEEVRQNGINQYITADLDDDYDQVNIQFTEDTQLKAPMNLDIIIALFVLHFKFYESQIKEIFLHLKDDGVFLANVYNRTEQARERLKNKFERAGFFTQLIEDPNKVCKNHYYLFAAKSDEVITTNIAKLLGYIKSN